MVGALGTGRLMGLLGARGMLGMLWVGGVDGGDRDRRGDRVASPQVQGAGSLGTGERS